MADFKPLAGVRVVEMSMMIAASTCGRMLADLGADVIKVEPVKGQDTLRVWASGQNTPCSDEFNPIFDNMNAGKRGLVLDTRDEKGLEVMYKLLETADAFVSNLRVKALAKQGLDYETLREKFPKLVCVNIGGYGEKGPEADRPGYDNTSLWARGGFLYSQAILGDYPVFIPMGFGDAAAGAMMANAVLAGVLAARTTGQGDNYVLSLYGIGCWLSNISITGSQWGIKYPKIREAGTPFGSPYKCKDGYWFLPLIVNFRDFPKYFETLGCTDLLEDEKYLSRANYNNREFSEPVLHRLEEAYAQKTAKEWFDAFMAADLAGEILYTYDDVREDPQARINGFTEEYTYPNGVTAVMERSCVQSKRAGLSEIKPGPRYGEHTEEVLKEIGLDEAAIKELEEAGIAKQLA